LTHYSQHLGTTLHQAGGKQGLCPLAQMEEGKCVAANMFSMRDVLERAGISCVCVCVCVCVSVSVSVSLSLCVCKHTHTHTHTNTYVYIYLYTL